MAPDARRGLARAAQGRCRGVPPRRRLRHQRRDAIERRLAKRHLEDGALVLYDLTSVWLEGRRCPLGRRGYSRDGKRGKPRIEFGLLCDAEGRPVAVEVFDGNTADPATVGARIDKLRRRFGFSRVVLVGDRGMLTEARIREDVRPSGLDWISALRGPAVRSLVESGAVQMSLFDETDLVEIDCSRPVAEVHNLIRGCNTQPGAWTLCNGERLQLFDTRRGAETDALPGTVLSVGDNGVEVAVAGGSIEVLRVRPKGSGKIPAGKFARSAGLEPGDLLG